MIFETGPYFEKEGKSTFYPRVEVRKKRWSFLLDRLLGESILQF